MKEAENYHVLPIDDRTIERTNPALAGRPDLLGDRTSLTLYEGMQGMLENTIMNVKNRFATIIAELEIPEGGGVGKGGKATLYMNGKPVAEGRVEKTQPNIFSADETADVGLDNQTPVAEGIGVGAETRFTGKIKEVTLEVKPVK